MLFRYRE